MSLVMSRAPKGIERSPTSIPPKCTETLVTSAPSSTSATPSSRSSSLRQARPAAIGEAMIAFTPKVRRADHRVDVAQRRRVGGDDVNVDAEPVGVKADRLLHAMRAVDGEQRRVGVKHDLAVAVDRAPAGIEQLVDVGLLDRDDRQARPRHWRCR